MLANHLPRAWVQGCGHRALACRGQPGAEVGLEPEATGTSLASAVGIQLLAESTAEIVPRTSICGLSSWLGLLTAWQLVSKKDHHPRE